MNRRQRRAARKERLNSLGRKHPSAYSAEQLFDMLVEDACAGYGPAGATQATRSFAAGQHYLGWFLSAVDVIGRRRGLDLDTVYREVEAAVMARTGRGMPL